MAISDGAVRRDAYGGARNSAWTPSDRVTTEPLEAVVDLPRKA